MSEDQKEVLEPTEDDKWRPITITPEDKIPAPVERTEFRTKFPAYRENYLKQAWPEVDRTLLKFGVKGTLDLRKGEMIVETTKKTWDPWHIISARDFINLMSRTVPLMQAVKIFDDAVFCKIIHLGKGRNNKEIYAKRRERIIGPNGSTLKALELLTHCYILVQGNTCCVMGPWSGIREVESIVLDCMKNIHPIYRLKTLMIKRELQKNPKLQNENWSRFLPTFKAKNVQRKKPKKKRKPRNPKDKDKEYTPFPPAQPQSKIDKQLISGEYFMTEAKKEEEVRRQRIQKQIAKTEERKRKRKEPFRAPEEVKRPKLSHHDDKQNESAKDMAKKLQKKLKKKKKKKKKKIGIDATSV